MESLTTTAMILGIGGLLFLVGLIAVILDNKALPVEAAIVIAGMYLAAWLAVMLKVIGQITRLVDAEIGDRKALKPAEEKQPAFVPPRKVSALPEYHEPASVTERTTRTLDEIKIERNG